MELVPLIRAARGRTPADLVVKNVSMLMTPTNEWITGDLAVCNDRIVAAGPETYSGKREIDGTGRFAVPGFIDAHVHIESCHALPFAFESAVLPRGTTTVVCDPHELANVCGKAAIRYFLDCAAKLRMDLRVQLSSCVPATPLETAGAALSAEDLAEFRDDPHVIGLAEFMNVPGVLFEDPGVLAKLAAFSGRVIDGHAPLVGGRDLNAYVSCGVGSDHECSTPAEALDKIRRGMTVFVREGSVAKNLNALAPVITPETVDFTALCTDDRNVLDITQYGHLDALIRQLIAAGVAPELAYRAASLSAARHFRMYDRGMLAPGRIADIVILDDVRSCAVHQVIKSGRPVDELPKIADAPDTAFALHSVKRAPISADDLRIKSQKTATPVIRIVPDSLLTEREEHELELTPDGTKLPAPERDILKLCVIARHGVNDNIGRGFVRGFGLRHGAFASSVGHDSHNLCVAGTNDEDMTIAVNTLIACGGGFAAVSEGRVLAKAEFPVGGLMSDKPFPVIVRDMRTLFDAVKQVGCAVHDPFMQLAFLPLPVIPFLKLTDKGLVDVDKFDFIEV